MKGNIVLIGTYIPVGVLTIAKVLLGTDPTFHFGAEPGAKTLIDNAVGFAAAGKTTGGASQTGLYFALSC